jgi:hypothetical protein
MADQFGEAVSLPSTVYVVHPRLRARQALAAAGRSPNR